MSLAPHADPRDSPAETPASVRIHRAAFIAVGLLLLGINLAVSPGYLWCLWVMGPWTVGLVLHAAAARELQRGEPRRTRTRTRTGRNRDRDRSGDRDRDRSGDSDEDGATRMRSSQHSVSDAPTEWESELPAPATGQPTLQPGQRVAGRFVIERPLGKGGMGEVYVARDEMLDEDVALKTISAGQLGEDAVARFHREAQAARRITHPNVIRIHDIGRDGTLSFISMAYVPGGTLGRLIHEELQLDFGILRDIALQLCDGLAAAHAVGVVHRDLKPDNVLIDERGVVHIIDFGLAKLRTADGLTATGAVMGTPEYMAPEQMRGEPADARTDIYALGCILYHAIAGTPPFRRDSAVAIGVAHCNDAPPPLRDYRPDVPADWEALVSRALQKEPADRFADVSALREAISATDGAP